MGNKFIWTDLSTFEIALAQEFYSAVFNWDYTKIDANYYYAHNRRNDCSGLYLMPEKLIKMKMPSFWMSYIQVENVLKTIESAKALGGIIELVEIGKTMGDIALIRDLSGAGFMVYDGHDLNSRTKQIPGTMVWNELFVSDFKPGEGFLPGNFQLDLCTR